MKNQIKKQIVLALMAITITGVTACGGSDDDSSYGDDYSTSSTSPTSSYEEEDEDECDYDGDCGGGAACRKCSDGACYVSYASPLCSQNSYNDYDYYYYAVKAVPEGTQATRCEDNEGCAEDETCDEFGFCAIIFMDE